MLPTLPYVWLVCFAIEGVRARLRVALARIYSLTTPLLRHRTPGSSVDSPYLYVVDLRKQEP